MKRIRKQVYGVVVAALVGVAANLVPPGSPASAAIPTAIIVNEFSAFNSAPVKTVTAACPAGFHVIGGGGQITAEHIFITLLEPVSDDGGDRFVVTAQEDDDGNEVDWFVRAQAVCAEARFVPGHQIVSRLSDPHSVLFVGQSATCSGVGRALGVGVRTIGPGNEAHVATQVAIGGPSSVFAGAFEDPSGFDPDWQVRTYAICADIDLFDREVVVVDSESNSEDIKQIEVPCPGGFRAVSGSAFSNQFASVRLIEVTPDRSGVVATAAEIVSTDADWSVQVRALCVVV